MSWGTPQLAARAAIASLVRRPYAVRAMANRPRAVFCLCWVCVSKTMQASRPVTPVPRALTLVIQKEVTMTKKSVYIERMKTQLDELNASMNKLDAKTQEAKEDARAMYLEEMGKLRHQSKLAVAKLEDMKTASEDTWETMVTEMEKVRDAFTHSFHYFKSQV
jgi:hypothetical protein